VQRGARSRAHGARMPTTQSTAIPGDAECSSEQGLCRRRSQRNDDSRRYRQDFDLEPGKAGLDLHRSRLAVTAPRTARHPFEMFDDVGDVGPRSIDAGLGKAAVKQLSRRSNKPATGNVLRITRLVADQHDERTLGAFTKHGPVSAPIQRLSSAMGRGLAQAGNRRCRAGSLVSTLATASSTPIAWSARVPFGLSCTPAPTSSSFAACS
jgi:hypothetical protein